MTTLLRPEDIPPRRRAKGSSDDNDLLTKELFSSLDREEEEISFVQERTQKTAPSLSVANKQVEDELTRAIFSSSPKTALPKASVLAPKTNKPIAKLSGQAPIEKPRTIREALLAALETTAENDIIFTNHKEESLKIPTPKVEAAPLKVFKTNNSLATQLPRAQEAKEQDIPLRILKEDPVLGSAPLTLSYADLSGSSTPVAVQPAVLVAQRKRISPHFFGRVLVSCVTLGVLAAVSTVASPDRVLGPISASIDSIHVPQEGLFALGASSFVVSNSENNGSFSTLRQWQAHIASLGANKEVMAPLNKFFAENDSFSWLLGQEIKATESLTLALTKAAELEEKGVSVFNTSTASAIKVRESAAWLLLYNTLTNRGGTYLFVGTNPQHAAPVMGEPLTYALVRLEDGRIEIKEEGLISDLNAALGEKIVPPEPVQSLKTSFDFFETGWFFETPGFGRSFVDIFEATTLDRVQGLFVFSGEFLDSIGPKMSQPFSAQPGWTSALIKSLGELSGSGQKELIEKLETALKSHQIEAYFPDTELTAFASRVGLVSDLTVASGVDSIALGLRSWEAQRPEVDLVEYQPHFFTDGSVVSNVRATLSNTAQKPGEAYVRFSIPKGSIVLGQEGFTERKKIPDFDYIANEFSKNPYLEPSLKTVPGFFPKLDFFEESGRVGVGGWVKLPAEGTVTVLISYKTPVRLSWQNGTDSYQLKAFKTEGTERTPFRFRATFDPDVSFKWEGDVGFLSSGLAEYQTMLRGDEVISATVSFSSD